MNDTKFEIYLSILLEFIAAVFCNLHVLSIPSLSGRKQIIRPLSLTASIYKFMSFVAWPTDQQGKNYRIDAH